MVIGRMLGMGNRPKPGPRVSQLAAGVAVGLLLIGGCSADRQQRQTAPPSSTSTASSSTTMATVRTVGDCTRPAGKGVADSSVGPFSAVKMVTARRGWAVGQGIIVGTDDGVHWSQQYSGPEPFAGIDAVDSLHAWAVGTQHLLATSDGGRHWSEVGEPTEPEGPLQSVDFVDADRGFGIAGFSAVVATRATASRHAAASWWSPKTEAEPGGAGLLPVMPRPCAPPTRTTPGWWPGISCTERTTAAASGSQC
jgi:hypothetical protein